ncbi:MAG: Rrf2 family transcriptional regulator [Desulfovibrio sp.]|nr:Rrf2 family transcriptional regulator [Desulfovibrio sp.]
MKLSAKTRYAARILFCMAKRKNDMPVSSSWLSTQTGISAQFIEQILRQLRAAGITASVRGARGGHILVQRPHEVTLGKILNAMEGGMELAVCLDCPESCDRCCVCAMREVWEELQENLNVALDSISLEDVLRKACPNTGC